MKQEKSSVEAEKGPPAKERRGEGPPSASARRNMKSWKDYLYALIQALFHISGAVVLGLHFRPLYYGNLKAIQALNPDYSATLIQDNYDRLIDYLNPFYRGKLTLSNLAMSPQGEFHFYEVKQIFNLVYLLLFVTLGLSLVIYLLQRKSGNYRYLKISAAMTFIIPLLLSIPFVLDFSRAFVVFHELVFSNDYWIFDPRLDPVITILPEWFFMQAAFLILFLMALLAFFAWLWGKKLTTKRKPY